MHAGQPAIFLDIPSRSRYLTFEIDKPLELKNALSALSHMVDGVSVVMGIGLKVVTTMHKEVPGLCLFPNLDQAPVPLSA